MIIEKPISVYHIAKDDLANWFNVDSRKVKKSDLEKLANEYVSKGDWHKRRFLSAFAKGVALSPSEVEEVLGCTRTERHRWTEEKKLPVVDYVSCQTPNGTNVVAPIYDRKFIEYKLTETDIQSWREKHKEQVSRNRSKGAILASQTRKQLSKARKQIIDNFLNNRREWLFRADDRVAAIFSLAYWTVWASRWAKTNHVKSQNSRKNCEKYILAENAWYARKDSALRLLYAMNAATVSFYRPEKPHKEHFHLCEEHFEDFCDIRRYERDFRVWDYFQANKDIICICPDCEYEVDKDWYSLYYLEIKDKRVKDFSFSFHVPYNIGRDYLSKAESLPRATNHEEGEGMFRFGRPVWKDEQSLYTEKTTLSQLTKAIKDVEAYLERENYDQTEM